VPFDYSQENYTQLLWFFEGGTSYYDNLLVRRAGLMSPSRYLARASARSLTSLHTTPGPQRLAARRRLVALVDQALPPDENSPNSAISYYLKGEIVCALLDLHVRRATNDAKGLDDVLRLLWARYGDESGVPETASRRSRQRGRWASA
jgi:predicted metalloprotease with PDZ domain